MAKTSVRGTMNATINDTGLVDPTNSYRIVARIATLAPAAGAVLTFTGSVRVNAV